MTDISAPPVEPGVASTRTGGPRDRREIFEHVIGWTLTVLVAMLITQIHLM
jgi:hypothetical protein